VADYKYVKKFIILKKTDFWLAVILMITGPLCLITAVTWMALPWQPPEPRPNMLQIFFLLVIGFFNTINGAIRLDRKGKDKLFEIKRKRIKLTEAEKLLGD